MEAIWKSLGDKPRAVQAETWKHWIVVVLDDKISEPASSNDRPKNQ